MMAIVIGVGNRFRGDDAVGLVVAERLNARQAPAAAVVRERDVLGLGDVWRDADVAVVVDAMASSDPPGSIRRFEVGDAPLPHEGFRCSTHGFGVADAVELARSTGSLPARLIVYGVVGGCFDHGEALSEPVARAVDGVVARILADVEPGVVAPAGGDDDA